MGVEATCRVVPRLYEKFLPIYSGSELKNKIQSLPDPNFNLTSLIVSGAHSTHEEDKKERWADQGYNYKVLEGEIHTDGVVEIKIPYVFLKNSLNMVLRTYKFFKDGEECELPNDLLELFPYEEDFKSYTHFTGFVNNLEQEFENRGIELKLNKRTRMTGVTYKVAPVIGEHICAYLWKDHLERLDVGKGVSPLDMVIKGKRVDVKTKLRPSNECQYYYQGTIPKYQERLDCDCYVFLNVPRTFDKALVLGVVSKAYFNKKGEFIPSGTRQWNCNSYNSSARSMQYNELPKWKNKEDVKEFTPTLIPKFQEQKKNEN